MQFGIIEKLTTDCLLLYYNAGLISKVSEKIASENAENCRCRQPQMPPSPVNLREYSHKPYIAKR